MYATQHCKGTKYFHALSEKKKQKVQKQVRKDFFTDCSSHESAIKRPEANVLFQTYEITCVLKSDTYVVSCLGNVDCVFLFNVLALIN